MTKCQTIRWQTDSIIVTKDKWPLLLKTKHLLILKVLDKNSGLLIWTHQVWDRDQNHQLFHTKIVKECKNIWKKWVRKVNWKKIAKSNSTVMKIRLLHLLICKKYLDHLRLKNNPAKFPPNKKKAQDLLQLLTTHFSTLRDLIRIKKKI